MPVNEHGQLVVNEHFQTRIPHIYAAGDVIGGHALASTAMEEARMAMDHAFPLRGSFTVNDTTFALRTRPGAGRVLPIGIWTIPEISMIGETEHSLRPKGMAHVVGRCRYDANPRGMLIGEGSGLLKLFFSMSDEKLGGAQWVGSTAGTSIGPRNRRQDGRRDHEYSSATDAKRTTA